MSTNFQQVVVMNNAFGNPQGDPKNIDWAKIRRQVTNVADEFIETVKALGLAPEVLEQLKAARQLVKAEAFTGEVDVKQVRDGLCDIKVFSYGAHHLMGIDADRDMASVLDALMTRFIKDEADLEASIALHRSKGVEEFYTEGSFPTMVLKSNGDYPDAPKGKFLKSASYSEPVFHEI